MRRALVALALAIAAAAAVAALIASGATLEETRDLFVIVYAVLGIVFFLAATAAALAVLFAVRALARAASEAYAEQAQPLFDDVRSTARTVRGSAEFVSDRVVVPLIRVVAAARGVRRGAAALARRGRRSP